jgi:hypothetical protein
MGGCRRPSTSSHLDGPLVSLTRRGYPACPDPSERSPPPRLLAQYVRIIVGAGVTDLHATPGGPHHNCVLRLLAFPLFLLSTNSGGTSSPRIFSYDSVISLLKGPIRSPFSATGRGIHRSHYPLPTSPASYSVGTPRMRAGSAR